jgi:hypothetical protein
MHESLEPGDPTLRWARRIEALFASPEALRALRMRVAEFARANWSWEWTVERYGEILRQAANSR